MNARMAVQMGKEASQGRRSRFFCVVGLVWLCVWPFVARAANSDAGRFHRVDLALPLAAVASNTPAPPLWKLLPKGEQSFNGVPFRIDGRIPLTGLTDARNGVFHLPVRRDVPVRRKASRFHLLIGAEYDEKDGVPLAKVVARYANGEERSWRISYGVQVRTWLPDRRERDEPVLDPASAL